MPRDHPTSSVSPTIAVLAGKGRDIGRNGLGTRPPQPCQTDQPPILVVNNLASATREDINEDHNVNVARNRKGSSKKDTANVNGITDNRDAQINVTRDPKPEVSPADPPIDNQPEVSPETVSSDSSVNDRIEVDSNDSAPIGIASFSVLRVREDLDKPVKKPHGSAHITVLMRIGHTPVDVKANICVDTGADLTLCTVGFITEVFGPEAVKHIRPMRRPPRLRSATGHPLSILGKINLVMMLGTYKLDIWVIVQEGDSRIFLLGSDVFYDRLIFDRGQYISFADEKHEPVPIHYTLASTKVKNVYSQRIAPKSSAMVSVHVTDDKQLIGKDVIVTPLTEGWWSNPSNKERKESSPPLFVRETVATVGADGNSVVMLDNPTDEMLELEAGCVVGDVHLLHLEDDGENGKSVYFVDESPIYFVKTEKDNDAKDWPENVLSQEFVSKMPDNLILRRENLMRRGNYSCSLEAKLANGEYVPVPPMLRHWVELSSPHFGSGSDIATGPPKEETKEEAAEDAILTLEKERRKGANVANELGEQMKKDDSEEMSGQINFIHDKEERRLLLDGLGEGFPTPPSAEPAEEEAGPDAWLENIERAHLTETQWDKLRAMLVKYKDAFTKSKKEIGCCTYFKASLPLKPGTGYLYNKPRPLPAKHREVARQMIDDLLEQGIIRPSKSPHATNVVVVKKKALNGVTQFRVCVDLRQVNANSIPNRFPNYLVEDAMAKIQGSVLRSSFDFANAFFQLVLDEESIPVTAFYLDNVLYEFVRLPFGALTAMNQFCCVMALLCENYPTSIYYADDLMICTPKIPREKEQDSFDRHLEDISGMLARIIKAGLKLKAHKCQWCYGAERPMDWLGFTLEDNLLRPQEAKVRSIKEFPVPVSVKQALSFV